MTAGRGDGGGRHARPDVPETTGDPGETGPDAPDQGTFGNSVTQPLPMVRREGLGEDQTPVRAVARRVASALPALGGSEIPDAPPSARANADRRRRAREAAAADEGDSAPADSDAPAPAGPESQPSASDAAPQAPAAPAPGPAAFPSVPENPQASVVPRQRTEPRIERTPELVVALAGPTAADDLPNEVELLPVGSRAHHVPVASGAEVSPPPGSRHSVGRDAEIVDAEIIDDRGHGRSPVDQTAAEVVSALTQVAFRDAQTDEWATVPSAHLGELEPVSHLGEVEPVRAHLGEVEPIRRGPGVLDSDSWDTTTSLPQVAQDDYQGKRRKDRRRDPSTRAIVVVALVVVALSAAVGLPFLMTSGDANPDTPPIAGGTTSGANRTETVTTPAGPSSTQGGIPVVTAPEASPTPSPDPSVSGGQSGSPGASASPSGGSSSAPPGPFSLTVQAEAGSLSGCALVSTVSGVTVVDRLGESNDWPNCWGHGTVTFNNVNLPSGTFRVTVHYVFGIRWDWDQSRLARLRIRSDATGSNNDHSYTYPRTTTCCGTWTTESFTVPAGSFDISFTHPGNLAGPDRAPALDRIVIEQVP